MLTFLTLQAGARVSLQIIYSCSTFLTWSPVSNTCYSGSLINDEDNQFSSCRAQAGSHPKCRRNPLFVPLYSQAAKQSTMERSWWGDLHFDVASKPVKHQQTWAQTGMYCWTKGTKLLNILGWWSLKRSFLAESPSGNWNMVSLWGQKNRVLCLGSITFALTTTQTTIVSPDHRLLVGWQLCFFEQM